MTDPLQQAIDKLGDVGREIMTEFYRRLDNLSFDDLRRAADQRGMVVARWAHRLDDDTNERKPLSPAEIEMAKINGPLLDNMLFRLGLAKHAGGLDFSVREDFDAFVRMSLTMRHVWPRMIATIEALQAALEEARADLDLGAKITGSKQP